MSSETAELLNVFNARYEELLREQTKIQDWYAAEEIREKETLDEIAEYCAKLKSLENDQGILLNRQAELEQVKANQKELDDITKKIKENRWWRQQVKASLAAWEEEREAHVESMYYESKRLERIDDEIKKIEAQLKHLVEKD